MKNETVNLFVSRMNAELQDILKSFCAEGIKPFIKVFFEKLMEATQKSNPKTCKKIEELGLAAHYFVNNTRNYEILQVKDFFYLNKIFEEFDEIFIDTLIWTNFHPNLTDSRVKCLQILFYQNSAGINDGEPQKWRNGMLFQDYHELWQIVHRFNSEWAKLVERGFSPEMLSAYISSVAKSEDNHFESFMALLDGKKKLIPVYKPVYNLQGFQLVETNSCNNEVVLPRIGQPSKPHHMITE